VTGSILGAADITADVERSCDVCVIGSGAGGAVLAAGLVERGLSVVMLEEGGHFTNRDFDLDEGKTFPRLYQGRGAWATTDLSMTILQGRSVGGGTIVNWTTCYRTPERILEHWRKVHGIEGYSAATLAPHFEAVERRLNIAEWPAAVANENNKVLLDGCMKLGWEAHSTRRNVAGCGNTGYCGLGCPLNAKQAMGITYIDDAVSGGLELFSNTKVLRLELDGGKVARVVGRVLGPDDDRPLARSVVVKPKVAVLSAGAIGSPAVLLRSDLTSGGRVGKRTWMHPVVAMPAFYEREINGFYGAPQSAASHQFIDRGPDKLGWFLETPPLQPMLISIGNTMLGTQLRSFMERLPHLGTLLSIAVDGLLPSEEGATVSLRKDGRIRIDYAWSDLHDEAFREAYVVMARLSLAAGATEVLSGHIDPVRIRKEADIELLRQRSYRPLEVPTFTAHQMGGCQMGPDPATSVVDPTLRHHDVPNLFVVDGSILPTALGVNPSETIYGIAHMARDAVASAV